MSFRQIPPLALTSLLILRLVRPGHESHVHTELVQIQPWPTVLSVSTQLRSTPAGWPSGVSSLQPRSDRTS